ncbi:E3 ubiquitin-protein ligase UPL6 (Ubiquitin-protein ligase 6) (HECT-type E3 ubiquitin transferase UPL6) [Durusdinium trenchii]|uniref:HECT-type E3 ubiquitin transferase n=1 Tax=Durusdinium trenchii TaxID=1381693 RepID=A0ABP0QIJ8_9DINO
MFDGSISETKVSLAGARNRRSETRAEFLRRQAREREDRERKRVRDISATKIQASWRRFRCRREQRNSQRELFDKRLGDLQKVEGLLPDVQRATFVFNALQKFLLRPFTFFFSGPEDAARLDTLLRLVCSSGQQPAATNIFASLLAEEEQQRQSILAQSRALLRALLQLEQNREALRLLLMIRDVIYDRASNAPVHPSRSPAAVGFLLRGTQVLQALPEQLPLDEESQAAAVDLVRLACVGMEASAEKPRRHLLLTLLSAPSLPELVDLMEQPRSFFECLQRQLPESCEDTEVLHEEVNGLKRLEWLAGNMGLLFSHLVPEPRILSWLAWTKAKLPLDFWTGHEKAVQRQRLWNAALARQLAGVEGSMLDDVLSFYFQVPASVADEPVDVSEDAVQDALHGSCYVRCGQLFVAMASLWNTLRSEVMGTVDEFRQKGAIGALRDAALDTKDMATDAGSWLWGNVKSLVGEDGEGAAVLCFDGVPPRGATAPLQFSDGRVVEAVVMEVDGVSDPPRAKVKVEGIEEPLLVLVQSASEVVRGEDDAGLLASIKQEWNSTVQDFREKGAVGALKDATFDAVDLVGSTAGKAVDLIGNTAGKAVDGARSLIDLDTPAQSTGAQAEGQGDTTATGARGSVMQLVDGIRNEITETVQDFREKGAVATFKDAALDAVDLVGSTATTAVNGAKTVAAPILEDFWAPKAEETDPPAAGYVAATPPKAPKAEGEGKKSLVAMRRGMFEQKKEEPKEEAKEAEAQEEEEEMAFKTNLIERLRPTGDVMRRLGDFTTPATLRLQAFALIFKFRLHGTFDAELDDPAGWWARLDAPQLLPYLNRVVVALLREEPDRRNLPLQGKALRRSLLLLLRSLCDRQRRKALAPGTWWLAPELRSLLQEGRLAELSAHVSGALGAEGAEAAEGAAGATGSGVRGDRELLETVLAEAPQMLPFEDRRDYLMEDGFAAFERLATTAELRALFVVEFVAADGSLESGIDGGGLFKEFMIYVCRTAFSPEYGLFTVNSDNRMYPFPGAFALHHDAEKLFRFLGKVVGKAIYEMMLLEPQFSRAFLNRVLHRESDIEDGRVGKSEHRFGSLSQIRDVDELGLSFTTAVALPSGITEVELLPGGAKMEENLDRYLQLLTLHRTSLQMDRQSAALRDGMECVLHPSWIQMFDARELSILISGSSTGFNVADLREHTVYAGGYTERSQVIQWLWELLESMDPEDQPMQRMRTTYDWWVKNQTRTRTVYIYIQYTCLHTTAKL